MHKRGEDEWGRKRSNREQVRAPRLGAFWCWPCDMQIVAEWAKCPVCGSRTGRRRHKK